MSTRNLYIEVNCTNRIAMETQNTYTFELRLGKSSGQKIEGQDLTNLLGLCRNKTLQKNKERRLHRKYAPNISPAPAASQWWIQGKQSNTKVTWSVISFVYDPVQLLEALYSGHEVFIRTTWMLHKSSISVLCHPLYSLDRVWHTLKYDFWSI